MKEVISLENDRYRSSWFKFFNYLASSFLSMRVKGSWMLFKIFRALSLPVKEIYNSLGIDYFNYPGIRRKLAQLLEPKNTVIQVYVVHGGYLDLPYLQDVSKKHLVVFRMPDAWLLSGHCAHSFDCDKWKTGCGECPDLSIPPKVKRDATAYNWRKKSEIYKNSRFHIVTPSRWLMNKVEQSMLKQAAVSLNVIPNGIDTEIFSPGLQYESRRILGIDTEATVLLFSANGIKSNRWKDFGHFKEVLNQLASCKFEKQIEFIGLGDRAKDELIGDIKIRYVAYQENTEVLVQYYRSADLYVHPSKVDSFPNSVLEALACGIPVVANDVGGIPEQIRSLEFEGDQQSSQKHSQQDATGILVPAGNSSVFFAAIKYLIDNYECRLQLGENARRDACMRFSQQRVTEKYIKLYHELISNAVAI
ncbi:MAG: glycosyltransferase [Cytophagales bacterium]|nr:glycosyltransferase [Cytophagales bacterium]